MAFLVYTDSVSPVSSPTPSSLVVYGSYSNADFPPVHNGAQYAVYPNTPSTFVQFGVSGNSTDAIGGYLNLFYDGFFNVRCYASQNEQQDTKFGATLAAKTNALAASAQTPTSSAVTSNAATIACNYTPNVYSSTCSAQLQYKKTTDPTWIDAGSPQTTGGSSQIPISRDIAGLQASTQYQVRLVITRTTNNNTSLTSATHSFTTLAGEPLVTTNAATGVSANTATLNGILDINEGTGVNVYFKWDTVTPPVANQTADQSKSADGSFDQGIAGLAASTLYYFQAFVSFSTPTGSPNEGSILSFTTSADPLAEAAAEDHVFIREFNERKYGVATKIIVPVAPPAATSSDRYFNAASPFVAGDVKVAQDTGSGLGAFTNVASLPVRIGTTPAFELDLSAAEMQGLTVIVSIVDQDGPAFRDQMIIIRTVQELGKVDVDASQLTNTTAFKVTGVGTGHGFQAIGGATGKDFDGILGEHVLRSGTAQTHGVAAEVKLDASANANDDYYNGSLVMLIAGTGAGQARVIVDYTGSSKVAVVDTSWTVNPANDSVFIIMPGSRPWDLYRGELSAMPADNASFGAKFQLIFQRFAFKIDQSAVVQQLYKADNSTVLASRSVSDAAGLQVLGKLS